MMFQCKIDLKYYHLGQLLIGGGKMIKALFVAPYKGLAEMVKRMNIPEYIDLDIQNGDLEEGVAIVKRKIHNKHYDLIISRGGTAKLIENMSPVPVIHIDITGYDMLRVFTLLSEVQEKVALVGFSNISNGASVICNILDFDVNVITINKKNEVKSQLLSLRKEGYSIVIGDVVTVKVAEEIGLQGILITSGKEAVLAACEEAKRIYHLISRTTSQNHYFKKAFNHSPLPTVIIKGNEVMATNQSFKEKFLMEKKKEIPLFIKNNLSALIKENNKVVKIQDEKFIYEIMVFYVDKTSSLVGLIICSYRQKNSIKNINIINEITYRPVIGNSQAAQKIKKKIEYFSYNNIPLCIVGENGTGKLTIAQQIHFNKFGKEVPILIINPSLTNQELLQELSNLERTLFLSKKGTVIIKDIHLIEDSVQRNLIANLVRLSTDFQMIGLINANKSFAQSPIYHDFFKSTIHLPPLRHRKDDIKNFVDYFLTRLHTEDGKDIVGIRKEALEHLLGYNWPGNISELRKVIQELRLETETNFIEYETVKTFMKQITGSRENNKEKRMVSIEGTLDDIEKRIIELVLEEEKYHQSNTAKRLGINRTTLWRKLR